MKKCLIALLLLVFTTPVLAEEPTEIKFSWVNNKDKIIGYRIYRDPTQPNAFIFPDMLQADVCPDGDERCYGVVPNIADGLNHRYVVTAYNRVDNVELESTYSNYADQLVTVEQGDVPAIPQNPGVPTTFLVTIPPIEVKVVK